MGEKTLFRSFSSFGPSANVPAHRSAEKIERTIYSGSSRHGGTPNNSDYICMENRRKYVFNEKK